MSERKIHLPAVGAKDGGSETPYLDAEEQRREREARTDYVADWLEGKTPPRQQPTPARIEIEVGEKREPDGVLREGPGLTIIAPEDDGMIERMPGGATRLVPGRRKRDDRR